MINDENKKKFIFEKLKNIWKKKSNFFWVLLLFIFVFSIIGLIAVIFAYIDVHIWSKTDTSSIIFIPKENIVKINNNWYIPIKLI
jgi:hypothetical protein